MRREDEEDVVTTGDAKGFGSLLRRYHRKLRFLFPQERSAGMYLIPLVLFLVVAQSGCAIDPGSGASAASPSGQQLIRLMRRSIKQVPSAHVVISAHEKSRVIGWQPTRLVESGTADLSRREKVINQHQTTRVTNTVLGTTIVSDISETYILVGHRMAQKIVFSSTAVFRRGKSSHTRDAAPWTCLTVGAQTVNQAVSLLKFERLPSHLRHATSLGASVVRQAPVWFVRVRLPRGSVVFSIAQSGYALLREAVTTHGEPRDTYTAIYDFSRFGEPVKATLPKACRHERPPLPHHTLLAGRG